MNKTTEIFKVYSLLGGIFLLKHFYNPPALWLGEGIMVSLRGLRENALDQKPTDT